MVIDVNEIEHIHLFEHYSANDLTIEITTSDLYTKCFRHYKIESVLVESDGALTLVFVKKEEENGDGNN